MAFHFHYQQLGLMLQIDLLVLLLYFWILAPIPIRLTCYTIFSHSECISHYILGVCPDQFRSDRAPDRAITFRCDWS